LYPTEGLVSVVGGTIGGRTAYVCRAFHPRDHSGPHSGWSSGGPYPDATPGAPPACIFSWGGGTEAAYEFDALFLAPPAMTPEQVAALAANVTIAMWPSASATPSPSLSSTPSAPPSASPSPLPPDTLLWRAVAGGAVAAAPSAYVATGVDADGTSPLFVCRVRPSQSNVSTGGTYNARYSQCAAPGVGTGGYNAVREVLAATPWLQWGTLTALGGEAGAAGVSAGATAAGASPLLCRAYHPTTRVGPLGGVYDPSVLYETGAPLGGAVRCPAGSAPGDLGTLSASLCLPGCLLGVGSAGTPVLANPMLPFQVLLLLPPHYNASGGYAWGARQPALVAPSPSTSPSVSPTPSASLAPPLPNTAQWLRLSNLSGWPGVLVGGTESGVWPPTAYTTMADQLFVCRCVDLWMLTTPSPPPSPSPTNPFPPHTPSPRVRPQRLHALHGRRGSREVPQQLELLRRCVDSKRAGARGERREF
jgi:hypothetical protein